MNIDIFTTFNPELEKCWKGLEEISTVTPFQSYSWLSHWQQTVGFPLHSIQPQLVVIQNEIETLAVLPLCIRNVFGVSILEWIGGLHTDYMLPLFSEKWKDMGKEFPICWQKILDKLVSFDVIHFQKQRKFIGLIQNPFVNSMSSSANANSYQSNLKNSWKEHYESTVKTKLRADSRRQRSRLEAFGELSFVVADDTNNKRSIIQQMINQKSRRYTDTGVWNMLQVLENRTFYEKLVDISDDYLKIHCSGLYVGKTLVASHVGFFSQSIFYYLMPTHEGGDWEKFSPGRLLLEHLLEWSIQNKLKIFDFTVGGEQYKKKWCDTETPIYETLESITFKGKIYIMSLQIKQTIKRWEHARKFYTFIRNIK
jgi:CelD/BcsL family acetyltransferase involved in cellulose biosynthesis